MNNSRSLSRTTLTLHWIIAVGMISLTALGIYMEEFEAEHLFDIHISFGALILIAVLPLLVWRYKEGWPKAVGEYTRIEHISGKIMHWVLLITTVMMPVSGLLMAIGGGYGLHIFGLELVAETPDPSNSGEALALSPFLAELGDSLHGLGGNILPLAIALHVVGAFKHHLIDKDETLRRMLGLQPR